MTMLSTNNRKFPRNPSFSREFAPGFLFFGFVATGLATLLRPVIARFLPVWRQFSDILVCRISQDIQIRLNQAS